MTDSRNVQKVVETVVKERFPDDVIRLVTAVKDVDSDGDPVLRVTVVFDSRHGLLDSDRMAGLVRHLRTRLAGADADLFPVVSYIALEEAAKLRSEVF